MENKPVEKNELDLNFLFKLLRLAKTYGSDFNKKEYKVIKDFVDRAFHDANEISPSDADYEPYKKD